MIAYNIPNRDCGQYSAGGVQGPKEYEKWIDDLSKGLGGGLSAIVLEPDALGLLEDCLSEADQEKRFALIDSAVKKLRARPGTAVYIDAGNANWIAAEEMAKRLEKAGVRDANGFALNVSNYVETDRTVEYGKRISEALGGKVGFVVDTSRNGRGAAPGKAWCNPEGRGLGKAPTAETGDPLVHAYLWLKRPGESDGECNGGPKAGSWFQERALELARNAAL
jgi:endoglucanase